MRGVEGNIHEERSDIFFGILDIIDAILTHYFTPVLASLPEALKLRIVRAPGIG